MRTHSEITAACASCGATVVLVTTRAPYEAACKCGALLVADWHAEPAEVRDVAYDVLAKIRGERDGKAAEIIG